MAERKTKKSMGADATPEELAEELFLANQAGPLAEAETFSAQSVDNTFSAMAIGSAPTGNINKDITLIPGLVNGLGTPAAKLGVASQLDFKVYQNSFTPTDLQEIKATLYNYAERGPGGTYDAPVIALGGQWGAAQGSAQSLYAPTIAGTATTYDGKTPAGAPLIIFHPATGVIDATAINLGGGTTGINGVTLQGNADGFQISGGSTSSRTFNLNDIGFNVTSTSAGTVGQAFTLSVPNTNSTLTLGQGGTLNLNSQTLNVTGASASSLKQVSVDGSAAANVILTNSSAVAFTVAAASNVSLASGGNSVAAVGTNSLTNVTLSGGAGTVSLTGSSGSATTLAANTDGGQITSGSTTRTLAFTGGNITLTTGTNNPNVTIPNLAGSSTALTTQATGVQYGVAYNSTAVNGQVAWTNVGTSGYPLVSAGNAAPNFQQLALAGATIGVTGTLGVTNGGTGTNTISSGQVLVGSATNVYTAVTPSGTNHISVSTSGGTFVVTSDGTNANTAGTLVARDGSGNFAAGVITATSITLTTGTISSAPVNPTDLVNKSYADFIASGFDFKSSTRVATTAALAANYSQTQAAGSTTAAGATITATANGAIVIDGITLQANDRVLVVFGITGTFTANSVTVTPGANAANGIYTVTQVGVAGTSPYILTRATDANDQAHITTGAYTFIEEGTTYADNGFSMITATDVTPITFAGGANTQMTWSTTTGSGSYTAGQGLFKAGSQFNASFNLTNGTNTFAMAGGGGLNATTGNNLTVTFNAVDATAQSLTLSSATDGFTVAGGKSSRTLTVTGGNATLTGVKVDGTTATNTGVTLTAANNSTAYVLGASSNVSLTSGSSSITASGAITATANAAGAQVAGGTTSGTFIWKNGTYTLDGTTNASDGFTLTGGATTARNLVVFGGNSTLKGITADGTGATTVVLTNTAAVAFTLGASSNVSLASGSNSVAATGTNTLSSFSAVGNSQTLTLTAATGSITLNGNSQTLNLTASTGAITLNGNSNTLTLASGGGNITLAGNGQQLTLTAAGGNITITGGGFTLTLGGSLSTAAALTFSGAFATTFTATTASSNYTLPAMQGNAGSVVVTTPSASQLITAGSGTSVISLRVKGSSDTTNNPDIVQFYQYGTTPATTVRGADAGVDHLGIFYGNGSGLTNVAASGVTGVSQYYVAVGTSTNALTGVAPSATAGVPLVSSGAAANPQFNSINLSLSAAVGTSVLLTTNGGTGLNAYTAGDTLYYNAGSGGNSLTRLAIGTTDQIMKVSGGLPVWGSINLAASSAVGTSILPTANGGTNAALTPTNGSLLYGVAAGVNFTQLAANAGGILYSTAAAPAWLVGTAGQVLLSGATGAPSFSNLSSILTTNTAGGSGITLTGTTSVAVAVDQSASFAPTWLGLHTWRNSNATVLGVQDSSDSNNYRYRISLVTNQQALILGSDNTASPKAFPIAMTAVVAAATATITAGDAVKFSTTGQTAESVQRATAGTANEQLIGVAMNTAAAGSIVYVARDGKAIVNVDTSAVAVGDYLGMSGTDGLLTSLGQTKSATGYLGRAMTTKAGGSTGQVTVFIDVHQATTTGAVTGTGTQYYHTLWNNAGGTTIGNSHIFENSTGSNITVGAGSAQVALAGMGTFTGVLNFPAATANTGGINFGADATATNLYRSAASVLKTDAQFFAASQIGVGQAPAATFTVNLPSAGTTAASGIGWGTGSNLYQTAAGAIKTDGTLTVAAGLTVTTGGATVSAGGLTVTLGGAAITGSTTVAGTFGVTGAFATSLSGSLTVTGVTQLNNTLTVAAGMATTLNGTLTVAAGQATTLGGGLTVGGFVVAQAGGVTHNSAGTEAAYYNFNSTEDTTSTIKWKLTKSDQSTSLVSFDSLGSFRAVTKSFDIPHPTKPGKRLVYGVLEGPEHGVYQRGMVEGKGKVRVELPEYWSRLAGADYTINLTEHNGNAVKIVEKDASGFSVIRKGLFGRWMKLKVEFYVVGGRLDVKLVTEEDEPK